MDRRQKMLVLAVSVAILGTASLYILSASMEHADEVLSVEKLLKNPQRYLNRDIAVKGNVSYIRNYTNSTVFYLTDGEYHLRCVYFGNITVEKGEHIVYGRLKYDEKWGNYEVIVEKISSQTPS